MISTQWLLGAGLMAPVLVVFASSAGKAAASSPGSTPAPAAAGDSRRDLHPPLLLAGLLIVAFAFGVWGFLECPLGGLGLEAFGLCTMARGAFPVTPSCTLRSGDCAHTIQETTSRLGMLAVGLACLAIGRNLLGESGTTLIAGYTLATGVAVLGILVALAPPVNACGAGFARRVATGGINTWMAILATTLLFRVE